jgi:hypothetical protein
MDVFSTELVIRLSFAKTSEFLGGGVFEPPTPLGTPLTRTVEGIEINFLFV